MTISAPEARIAQLEQEVAALRQQIDSFRGKAAQQLRGIADALPVMISYIDADERYQFANKAYEPWLGRSLDEIVGRRVEEALGPEQYANRAPFIHRALAGERVEYEAEFQHSSGPRRTKIHHIPHISKGRVIGFYALIQDITEEWRALETIRESEARFRRIADSAPVPIWVTAPDRTREFVNQAYVNFLGVSYGEALRFDWRSILHEDDHDRIIAESLAGEASHARFALEARYRRHDGEWRWVRSISQPRFAADGMPEGFIGVAADITEAKRAEESATAYAEVLQESVDRRTLERDRLWSLSSDAFLVCNEAGVWLSASPAWTTLLGWSQEQLLGRTSEWMEHPDDREVNEDARDQLRAGVPLRAFTNRLRAADGSYRRITWSAVPEGRRAYCIARDITGEHERAEAMRTVEDALRQSQKMEALGQLTGGVAHDFNNLLTPILGTLDLLLHRSPERDRQARLVEGAHASALRAKTLVQRLLAFARRQPLKPQPTDVASLVAGMQDLLRSTIGRTVKFSVELADELPPALVDANQLEMALLNLVVNARDAIPDGGRVRIALAAHEQLEGSDDLKPGRYLSLTVSDTGRGMDAETMRRAIEPFFSTKASGAGTGLGLSMVHGLMGQLGGALHLDSSPGQGTRVEMLLPASVDAVSPAGPPRPDESRTGAMKILLVDDEPLVRANTAAMLTELNHEVVDCGSGPEALRLMEGGLSPDLLVTDQVMPQMNGTQLVEAVRARRPALPALIISGYPQGDEMRLAVGRLAKPFGVRELADAMARLPGIAA